MILGIAVVVILTVCMGLPQYLQPLNFSSSHIIIEPVHCGIDFKLANFSAYCFIYFIFCNKYATTLQGTKLTPTDLSYP